MFYKFAQTMAQRYEFFVSLHYPAGAKTIRVTDTHCNNKKDRHCPVKRNHRLAREEGAASRNGH